MTLHLSYESLSGVITDLAATDHIRLPDLEVTMHAEEGVVGRSSITVEDVGGALDLTAWRRIWLWESAESPGNQVIGTFRVTDREIGRKGGIDDQVVSTDRWWKLGLVDHNTFLQHRVITRADGDRPAETDIQRLNFLLNSNYYTQNVDNTGGYISTSGPVQLDKADLRGQRVYDVIHDCAEQSNKNFHLIPNNPSTSLGAQSFSLWYDFDYAGVYLSTLRLSNDRADVDNSTTFFPLSDATLTRNPERVYSGVYGRGNGVETYIQRPDTANDFTFRDTVFHASNISNLSTLTTRVNRYLDDADSEEDRISCRFVVPKEKVNGLREGQLIQVKFVHFPAGANWSYTDFLYTRCLKRTVRQMSDEFYEIRVELVPAIGPNGALSSQSSVCQLSSPDDDNFAQNTTFTVTWTHDGDNPRPGDPTNSPQAGLLDYQGPVGTRTGIVSSGWGTVSVHSKGSIGGAIGGGDITLTVRVLKNGVPFGSDQQATSGGARAVSFEWDITTTTTVASGDVITTDCTTVGYEGGDIFVIPLGTGSHADELLVSGTLVG